ncbi:hypothetical protein U9M48_007604 [Paspalum notatum var. saurae]|uniref:Uncharacterized protein n=1 Tax=Paspalum notatum var. saurae TaxID=547442 RepID=A0AAQ3WC22_PASNO
MQFSVLYLISIFSAKSEARYNMLDDRRRSMGPEAQVSLHVFFPSWDGLKTFLSLPRQSLQCSPSIGTKGFVRSYKNLHFYWILGAGHYVPVDQPCIALSMIGSITQSPAS